MKISITGLRFVCILWIVIPPVLTAEGACPFSDSAWSNKQPRNHAAALASTTPLELDDRCFVLWLKRKHGDIVHAGDAADIIDIILARVSKYDRFPLAHLAWVSRSAIPGHQPGLYRDMLTLWERHNGRMQTVTAARIREYAPDAADSLYAAFEAGGRLESYDYIRWADCDAARRRPLAAAKHLCRAHVKEARIAPIARSRLLFLLRDYSSDTLALAVQRYAECALSSHTTDTAMLRSWLSRTYGGHNLYEEQLDALLQLERPGQPVTRDLLSLAAAHYAAKRWTPALRAAREALVRIDTRALQLQCITIIYHSWDRLGVRDSAISWALRIDDLKHPDPGKAICLYQNAGMLARSAAILSGMHRGCERDTLLLRQLLYSRKTVPALDSARHLLSLPRWTPKPGTAGLWRIRTLLFGAEADSATRLLDTLAIAAHSPEAAELLTLRYQHMVLQQYPSALGIWRETVFRCWRRDSAGPLPIAQLEKYPEPVRRMLIIMQAQAFLPTAPRRCLALFERPTTVPPSDSTAIYRYHHALVLLENGRKEKAVSILRQCILDHPYDVYSGKARILLARNSHNTGKENSEQ